MSDSSSKPLPSAYEIAAPLTYDAFDLSAATTPAVEVPRPPSIDLAPKESAQKTRAPQPKKTADDWIDSKDETPEVKEKDKDKFEGPDELSGGIEKFAASLGAVDGPPREKRAVWVVHGMGQQIPFETLDSLANGILDVLPNVERIIVSDPAVVNRYKSPQRRDDARTRERRRPRAAFPAFPLRSGDSPGRFDPGT